MNNEKELVIMIKTTLTTLEKMFKRGKKTPDLQEVFSIMQDLDVLINEYNKIDYVNCAKIVIKRYIKLINLLLKIETSGERQATYYDMLENAYRIGARISLEHFIIYFEWNWNKEDKLLENRYPILHSYVYYLNKMCFDRSFEGIIANLPSGYGKSRVCRYYEAFRLGVEPTGTFLALCSNDDLIKGQSRSVIDIIKDPRFGQVFPNLRYSKEDKDFFLKETDGEWKLRDCKLISSYYAKTTRANVVGLRASLSVDIDDLYQDSYEAMDDNLNKKYFDTFLTVWRKRYVQNLTPQIIITGTLWSPIDFLAKVIRLWEGESEFIPHPNFKYTKISKDGKKVIIQVPALDYETGLSTCPEFKKTEDLLKEKASMSTYLWETNFQQRPTSPEGLFFDWSNLQTYEILPLRETDECMGALDPNRRGNDYISMPIFTQIGNKHYLVDWFFSKKSLDASYEDICNMIIKNKVTTLVVEINTEASLKDILYEKLEEKGYYSIKIIELYSTDNKELKIRRHKESIVNHMVFPCKTLYGLGTMVGKGMEQFTMYSFEHPNKHDDAPDSLAMYDDQIVHENGLQMKAEAMARPF